MTLEQLNTYVEKTGHSPSDVILAGDDGDALIIGAVRREEDLYWIFLTNVNEAIEFIDAESGEVFDGTG